MPHVRFQIEWLNDGGHWVASVAGLDEKLMRRELKHRRAESPDMTFRLVRIETTHTVVDEAA